MSGSATTTFFSYGTGEKKSRSFSKKNSNEMFLSMNTLRGKSPRAREVARTPCTVKHVISYNCVSITMYKYEICNKY
jgi:hypothetical protein